MAPPESRTWTVDVVPGPEQGDVGHEEADQSLALAHGGAGIGPQGGEVGRKGADTGLLFVAQRGRSSGPGPLVVVLGVGQLAQLVVPVGFECLGHQAVVGVDGEVAPPGRLGGVSGPAPRRSPGWVGLGRPVHELRRSPRGRPRGRGASTARARDQTPQRRRRCRRSAGRAGCQWRCPRPGTSSRPPGCRRSDGGSRRSSACRNCRRRRGPAAGPAPLEAGPARRSSPWADAFAARRRWFSSKRSKVM